MVDVYVGNLRILLIAVQYSQGFIAIAETVRSRQDLARRRLHSFPKRLCQLKGVLKYFSVTGTDGAVVERGFCERCGSQFLVR